MNPFRPSSEHQPLKVNANPKDYIAFGSGYNRGDKNFIMSRGELVRFSKNPWKWLHGSKNDVTREMNWGSAVDCLVLTPLRFKESYAICPETYVNEDKETKPWNLNAKVCKQWVRDAKQEGMEIIKVGELEDARIAAARLREDAIIAKLLDESDTQVQCIVEYHDKETGLDITIKTLLDLVPRLGTEWQKALADLKTTNDAAIYEWEKTVYYQGYCEQSALYTDAYNAVTGEDRSCFLHAIQESDQPYATARRMLSEEFMQIGRERYQKALKRYCRCLEAGKFPGYDDENDNASNPILDGWRITNPSGWMIE